MFMPWVLLLPKLLNCLAFQFIDFQFGFGFMVYNATFNNIMQLLHLNEINMGFYGAEYNNIERGFASFNIVVPCSIKPHIDQVQVQ